MEKYSQMKLLYNQAKKAKVGDNIRCPHCNKKHVKTTYHKVFCSNYKTKSTNNCKDNFWNKVDPEKRCRKTDYYFDVILTRNAPNVHGGSGRISGYTSEGYRIMDGVAYDEWDEAVYNVDPYADDMGDSEYHDAKDYSL